MMPFLVAALSKKPVVSNPSSNKSQVQFLQGEQIYALVFLYT
jgi:hypothetical protein